VNTKGTGETEAVPKFRFCNEILHEHTDGYRQSPLILLRKSKPGLEVCENGGSEMRNGGSRFLGAGTILPDGWSRVRFSISFISSDRRGLK
jgi:hypothetical protein